MLYIEKFNRLLLSGEKLLWTGRAGGGFMLTRGDIFMIPFSLLWGGFTIFWEYKVLQTTHGAITFPVLWGLLFIVLGCYIMVGRFFIDAYARSKTFYALTGSRLLILREGPLGSTQTFQLGQLPSAQFSGSTSGSGTIDLSDGAGLTRSFVSWTPSFAKGARLLKIENAWQVFTLIQQTQFQPKTIPTS